MLRKCQRLFFFPVSKQKELLRQPLLNNERVVDKFETKILKIRGEITVSRRLHKNPTRKFVQTTNGNFVACFF